MTTDGKGSFAFPDSTASSRLRSFYRLERIVVTAPTLRIRAAADGPVVLSGTGQPGQMYSVLGSEDLKVWTVVGVVKIDAGGSFQFTDPAAKSRPRFFYRLQSIPVTGPKLQIRASAGGPMVLSATGQAAQTYIVLSSQNLTTWTAVGTMTLDAAGSGQFTDPTGNSRPHCMYRLLAQ